MYNETYLFNNGGFNSHNNFTWDIGNIVNCILRIVSDLVTPIKRIFPGVYGTADYFSRCKPVPIIQLCSISNMHRYITKTFIYVALLS